MPAGNGVLAWGHTGGSGERISIEVKKIRQLRLGEDVILKNNPYAREAMAELEESGDAVRVILHLAEQVLERQELLQSRKACAGDKESTASW